jgi:alginate O-acetyltransferase complex protein AlgI
LGFNSYIRNQKLSPVSPKTLLAILIFILAYGIVLFRNNWNYSLYAGGYTLLLSLGIWLIYRLIYTKSTLRKILAYFAFFVTPTLTFTGAIGVLTGFDRSSGSMTWLGISFVTAGIAFHIFTGKFNFKNLCLNILQPARFNSGPVAVPVKELPRLNCARAWVYIGWIILGSFFFCVLAAKLSPFLVLRHSPYSLDILTFAFLFEIYVYFNFCGISFVVFGILNLAGVRTILNFNSPFSARDVIGYWQRWHISLSTTLKELFYKPAKNYFGLVVSIFLVFISSAMWHGMSLNFILWGLFHGCAWLLTYVLTNKFLWPRMGRVISLLIFLPVIVFGRLIFSEQDPILLLSKVENLLLFQWNNDAYILNLTLDTQSIIVLAASISYIGAESLLPRPFVRYRIMRNKWVLFALLSISLAYGTLGIGGIYGTR